MAYCTECGAPNSDDSLSCISCGSKLTPPQNGSINATPKIPEPDIWNLLFGSAEYSVSRAKWFYIKAEKIINIVNVLLLIFGGIALIFTFAINPYLGFAQLLLDIVLAVIFFIYVVFTKLILMGIGSSIRQAEILELQLENIKKS